MDAGALSTISALAGTAIGALSPLGTTWLTAESKEQAARVAAEREDGRLVALDVAGLPVTRHWFVIRRTDKILLPPAQAAFDFMVEEAGRFLPRMPGPGR